VATLFFAALLSPMIGFVPLYTFYFSYVADHYQYFASLALMVLAAALAVRFFQWRKFDQRLPMALAGLLLALLGTLTFQQCCVYRDPQSLWEDTLAKNPGSWLADVHLGEIYARQNRIAEAEKLYLAGLALNPDEEAIRYNYGNLLARTDRLEEAVMQYQEAVKSDPNRAKIHNNLGSVFSRLHRKGEAIAEFRRAIECQPDFADPYFNLGNMLWAEHQYDEAAAAFRRAVELKPDSELFRKRLQTATVPAN
jgi:protein O-mannosyl-transferase